MEKMREARVVKTPLLLRILEISSEFEIEAVRWDAEVFTNNKGE